MIAYFLIEFDETEVDSNIDEEIRGAIEGLSYSNQIQPMRFEANVTAALDPKSSKLSTTLFTLSSDTNSVSSSDPDDNFVVIDAIANGEDGQQLLADLEALGLTNGASFGRVVSGVIPIEALTALENLDSLASASQSISFANVGSVTTQADASIQSDIARLASGVDGSGSAIGVLSDSFDNLGGFAADVASGDLPSFVNVLQDFPLDPDEPETDEGRAILQLIHDVAPGADLLFHTAFLGIANFAQGIIDLANAGANIIIDDVIFFAEPFFQDGVIAQAVDQVASQGVLFFSSAGNSGTDSYSSFYRDSGIIEGGDVEVNGQTFNVMGVAHDFDPGAGVDTRQLLSLGDGQDFNISFQYDESSLSSSGVGPTSDYDIFLFEAGTNNIVASSVSSNNSEPVEIFTFTNETGSTQNYELVITRFSGSTNNFIQYIDFAGQANILEFDTNSPTLVGHANAAGAIAVGASAFFNTPEFGVNPPALNGFSSVGGVDILFDTNGNRLVQPESRGGPAFTAVDGGNTTFFGNDIGADSDSFPNFFGTSASAPVAAAAAALLLEAVPGATGDQVIQALSETAIDIGAPGVDLASGAGLIQVPAAIDRLNELAGSVTPPPSPTPGDDVLQGTSGADSIDALAGNDNVSGLDGNDTLFGNDGNDSLFGGAGLDIISGGIGADFLDGGLDEDSLVGGGGPDTILGGDGNDTLLGNAGPDSLEGGSGDDFLDGATNNDTIRGFSGDDTIIGSSGSDSVFGGTGNDSINVAGGTDFVSAGAGNDTVLATGGADFVDAGDGDDFIEVGTNVDTVLGGGGNDTISALSGFDLLDGGDGFDLINGGAGPDTLFGGNDGDTILGGVGPDSIDGGNGDDFLDGETNNDVVLGGLGNDTIFGQSGFDLLSGGGGNDLIDSSGGFDTVLGGDGNDTITTGNGADIIDGGDGDDLIDAGTNSDVITGGAGNDTITASSGGDTFIFANGFGDDLLVDFNPNNNLPEQIDLSAVSSIASFQDLVDNHLLSLNGDAVIVDGVNSITLSGVDVSELTADDFIF